MGWLTVLEDHYPDLVRALGRIEAEVGNRHVTVSEVLARDDGEVPRIEAVLYALGKEAAGVIQEVGLSPRSLGVRLAGSIYLAFEFGLWLGEGHLASVDPNHIKRRLAQIGRGPEMKGK